MRLSRRQLIGSGIGLGAVAVGLATVDLAGGSPELRESATATGTRSGAGGRPR